MDRPYVSPSSSYGSGSPQSRVSHRVIDIMSRTKGWVRFIAVVLFVMSGFVLIYVIMSIGGMRRYHDSTEQVVQMITFAAMLLLLHIYPAVKLNSYANRIGVLLRSARAQDLEAALNEHRALWRFVGIVSIVIIGFFVVMFLFGVIAGASRSRW